MRWRDKQLITIILVVITSLALPSLAMSEKGDWPDWPQHSTKNVSTGHSHPPLTQDDSLNPLVQGIRFFQRYISVVDSPRCPMYPTCSAYALQALDKHGPLLGSFITVDRLLHETNPLEQTEPLSGFERERFYDPLSRNDFWLSQEN